jgi:serine/threonine protein kinase
MRKRTAKLRKTKVSLQSAAIEVSKPTVTSSNLSAKYVWNSSLTTGNGTAVPTDNGIALPGFVCFSAGTDFEVHDMIGEGGMGSIFNAKPTSFDLTDKVGDSEMVVKIVGQNESSLAPTAQTIFHQEVVLIWKFQRHPNVVKMYGWSSNPAGILLRKYTCGDLRRLIKSGSESLDYNKTNIISVMKQVSSAVACMHSQDVVHCDLKSSNILLDLDLVSFTIIAVLADFGIARVLDQNSVQVAAFELANANGVSISYAAPETLTRFRNYQTERNFAVWKAGDLYSLAIILLEMMVRGDAWDHEHRKRYGRVIPTYDPATQMAERIPRLIPVNEIE